MDDQRRTAEETAAANFTPYPKAEITPPNPAYPVKAGDPGPQPAYGVNELPCGHPLTEKVQVNESTWHCRACNQPLGGEAA
jgi:hypothetical protein